MGNFREQVMLMQHRELNRALEQILPLPQVPKPVFPQQVVVTTKTLLNKVAALSRYPSRLLGSTCHLVRDGVDFFGLPGALSLYTLALERAAIPFLQPPENPELQDLHEGLYLTSYSYGQFLLSERVLKEGLNGELPELIPPINATKRFLRDELEFVVANRLALENDEVDAALVVQWSKVRERFPFRPLAYHNFGAIVNAAAAANHLLTMPQLQAYMAEAGLVDRVVDDQVFFFPNMAKIEVEQFHDRMMPYVAEAADCVLHNEYYEGESPISFRGEYRESGRGWVAGLLCINDFLAEEFEGSSSHGQALMRDGTNYALLNLFEESANTRGALFPMLEMSAALLAYDYALPLLEAGSSLERAWQFQFAQHPWLGQWIVDATQFITLHTKLMRKERGLLAPGEAVCMPAPFLYSACRLKPEYH